MAASTEIPDPKKEAKVLLTQTALQQSFALGVPLRIHHQFPVSLSFTISLPQASVGFPVELSPPAAGQRFSLKENTSCSSSSVFKFSAAAADTVGSKTSRQGVSTASQCCEKVRQTENLLRTRPFFHGPCRQGPVPSVWKNSMIIVTISLCFQTGFSFQSSCLLGSAFYY